MWRWERYSSSGSCEFCTFSASFSRIGTISAYADAEEKQAQKADKRYSTRNLGMIAHFEDVAVSRDQKGKKMGLRILEALIYVARELGCYKVRFADIILVSLLTSQ